MFARTNKVLFRTIDANVGFHPWGGILPISILRFFKRFNYFWNWGNKKNWMKKKTLKSWFRTVYWDRPIMTKGVRFSDLPYPIYPIPMEIRPPFSSHDIVRRQSLGQLYVWSLLFFQSGIKDTWSMLIHQRGFPDKIYPSKSPDQNPPEKKKKKKKLASFFCSYVVSVCSSLRSR